VLHTKLDLQQELTQARSQKEESDAIINNLRKTIRDMAKQMRSMEGAVRAEGTNMDGTTLRAAEALYRTPSLAQISPRCRSEAANGRTAPSQATQADNAGLGMDDTEKIQYLEAQLDVKQKGKQTLQIELNQKHFEIDHLMQDNENFTR